MGCLLLVMYVSVVDHMKRKYIPYLGRLYTNERHKC